MGTLEGTSNCRSPSHLSTTSGDASGYPKVVFFFFFYDLKPSSRDAQCPTMDIIWQADASAKILNTKEQAQDSRPMQAFLLVRRGKCRDAQTDRPPIYRYTCIGSRRCDLSPLLTDGRRENNFLDDELFASLFASSVFFLHSLVYLVS